MSVGCVKAKFCCQSVEDFGYSKKVNLRPVYGTGEENKSWSQATPSGNLEMTITNLEAADYFIPGHDYFLTIERS